MAHVLEDIEASGWTPNGSMNVPPATRTGTSTSRRAPQAD